MATWLRDHGASPDLEVVVEGETDTPDAARREIVTMAEAGATWWIESRWELPAGAERDASIRRRLAEGPPRID
jgi:hypothetical protein